MDSDFFCAHSALCKTLANDKRQMVLSALRDGELTVSQLVTVTGMSQPNLSQHLARMRAVGVVRTRRDGSHVFYAIANPKLLAAFDLITEVLEENRSQSGQSQDAAGLVPPDRMTGRRFRQRPCEMTEVQ